MSKRIIQANLNNQGGAFSLVYEAQKKLNDEFVFDYFSPEKFVNNEVYSDLLNRGSKCIGGGYSKNRLLKQFSIYRSFKKYLLDNNYWFVHIHSDTSWKMVVYYLAAKRAGINNVVVHSHSSGIGGHYRKINYLLHLLCRPIVKRAKYRCACSDAAAEWMFGTKKNVTIIQNGVDIEKFKFREEKRAEIRKQYGLDDEIKLIGSVSDFSYPKNPEFIFKLIREFKNDGNYKFMLVGNRDSCKLKEWAEADETIQNVIFVGTVTNVEAYLSAMSVFILPSRFEGLPMCAVEAQVSGLYTIISNNISEETQCSVRCGRLPLDVKIWKKQIEKMELSYNRGLVNEFLVGSKFNISGTAEELKRLYYEEN